jgi:plasmid stabilization system protein ParE
VTHSILPEADAEFAEAIRYYAEIDPRLGVESYHEVVRVIREVCAQPRHFRQIDPPVRRALTDKFPYAVVFAERPQGILIVAVMHGMRRPGYWRSRIR